MFNIVKKIEGNNKEEKDNDIANDMVDECDLT